MTKGKPVVYSRQTTLRTPNRILIDFSRDLKWISQMKHSSRIEYYSIIYDAIESVESRMQEVLSPTPEGEFTGSALVQEVFNIGGTGNIAGSRCTEGILRKGGNVRVMRGDKILTESKIRTLRNFKAETDTIEAGNECGIGLLDYEDFEAGDVIECYVE